MLLQTWSEVLTASFQNLWVGVVGFVPNLVVSIIIFIVGWVVGVVLGKWVAQVIHALKVDKALNSLGIDELVSKAGFRLDSGAFIGALVRWFVIIVFLVAALDVLQLTQVNIFLQQVVLGYLPNVIVAAFILLIAAVIAEPLKKVVSGSARAAEVASSALLGGVAYWAIWVFAFLAALNQLGIAGAFFQTLFTGIIAMIALAGGLAFGLGGKEAAARYLDKLRSDISR
ncbi:MAG: hypothetical protein A2114_02075 [Candidatus Vogelbacteria bacterium GWA1_51_14]|uniref:Small-conductance mechanosensitive ion channel n=1 Tax=Candidatus Vogelbacteria bacterium GWA1_51_14 TaxID=1802435 RepID=A0A1G2QBE5_9BACT|nr:MAG: hypothetical protein A2114_02075 [Candidatus Vogelbacteria bacterium GWA1_51_14]